MHCPYCGKEISENAKVCPYCGREQKRKKAQVEKVVEAKPPEAAIPVVEAQAETSPKIETAKKEKVEKKEVVASAAAESAAPPAATKVKPSGRLNNSSGLLVNNRLWLALGVLLVATVFGEAISTGIISQINDDLYFSASGVINGLIVWLALRALKHPVSSRQGLTIVSAWTIAFAAHPLLMGTLGWVVARVLGAAAAGYATGAVLLRESPNIRKNYPVINAIGWSAGWIAGFLVVLSLGYGMPVVLSLPLDTIILILVAAAIGGFALLWPLTSVVRDPIPRAEGDGHVKVKKTVASTSSKGSNRISADSRLWLILIAMLTASILNEGISNSFFFSFNTDFLPLYFAPNGAIYGLILWLGLRMVKIPLSSKQGISIVAAWSIAWVLRPILGDILGVERGPDFAAIGWILLRTLAAALAGFATGVVLQRGLPRVERNLAVINSVGWGAGWLLGSLLARAIPTDLEYLEFGQPLFMFPPPNWIFGVLLAVAIGGYALLWPLNETQ